MEPKPSEYLLEVERLKMHFPIRGGVLRRTVGSVYAVDDVSFGIRPGETFGLVGESGCGKTTVGRTVMRLYRPTAGTVRFRGRLMGDMNREQVRRLRRNMQMIFQDPYESLNARHTVRDILEEPFAIHDIGSRAGREAEIRGLLGRVGLSENALTRFPHEFSGGQRQRIGIARAIALKPKLVICDEPVSALDVSIQSQILNLLLDLQEEMGLAYLFIAHDLAVVKHVSDRIGVMYLGNIVEVADAGSLYRSPWHPYTVALMSAIPVPDPTAARGRLVLSGDVPSPAAPPAGCRFHTRCPVPTERCRKEVPALSPAPGNREGSHRVACHRAAEVPELLSKYLNSRRALQARLPAATP
jgi:peptide/nickel transport system ATP-binding protein